MPPTVCNFALLSRISRFHQYRFISSFNKSLMLFGLLYTEIGSFCWRFGGGTPWYKRLYKDDDDHANQNSQYTMLTNTADRTSSSLLKFTSYT